MEKTLILLEDLHRTIEYMYKGTATVTFSTNESNTSIWEIRGPKKELVVMLRYQNVCKEADESSATENTIIIKEEPRNDVNMCHQNESSQDIEHSDAAVVVHKNTSDADYATCQSTKDYSSQSTTCNSTSSEEAVSVQSTTYYNVSNEDAVSHLDTYIESNANTALAADKNTISHAPHSTSHLVNDYTSQLTSCESMSTPVLGLDWVGSITKVVGDEFEYSQSIKSESEHELINAKLNYGPSCQSNSETEPEPENINLGTISPCLNRAQDTRTSPISFECKTYFNSHDVDPIVKKEIIDSEVPSLLENTGTMKGHTLQIEPDFYFNDTSKSLNEDNNIICEMEMMKLKNCSVLLEPLDITSIKTNYVAAVPEPDKFNITGQEVTNERNGSSVECSKCGKNFFMKVNLESHLEIVHNKNLCPCCDNPAGCECNTVNVHHQDHSLHDCSECLITFSDMDSYNLHMQNKHFGYSQCKNMQQNELLYFDKSSLRSSHKELKLKYSIKTKKLIHSGGKAFECSQCGKMCSTKYCLKLHMKSHSSEKTYECSQCFKKFFHKGILNRHMVIHSEVKPHECSLCNKKFNRKEYLKKHELVHSGIKPYECSLCNKKFLSQTILNRHMVTHSGVKSYECSQCFKKFFHRGNLNRHMVIHSEAKPHECSQCNKKFNRKEHLKKHELVHSGIKPYECSLCNKKFLHKAVFNRHMIIHSDVKPHECSQCNKKFNRKEHLKIHELAHSGIKPYECSECNKKFLKKYSLSRHMVIHSVVAS